MPVIMSIMARQKGLHAMLMPIGQGIKVKKGSVRASYMPVRKVTSTGQGSLQSSTYCSKLDSNIKAKDLTGGAYDRKMLVRHTAFHFSLSTTLSLYL